MGLPWSYEDDLTWLLKELSDGVLSYFGHAQNYLKIERNMKIVVYYDRETFKR